MLLLRVPTFIYVTSVLLLKSMLCLGAGVKLNIGCLHVHLQRIDYASLLPTGPADGTSQNHRVGVIVTRMAAIGYSNPL